MQGRMSAREKNSSLPPQPAFAPLGQAVLETFGEGVVVFDPYGRMLYANQRARLEREEFQSPPPAGVRAPRSGGAGNVRRGGRGVRPVRSDAVREPAGPSRDRRARRWRRTSR